MNSEVECNFNEQGVVSIFDKHNMKCWSGTCPLNLTYFNRKDFSLHKLSVDQSGCKIRRVVETENTAVFEYDFTEPGLIFNNGKRSIETSQQTKRYHWEKDRTGFLD